jgi:hypothetical protein
MLLLLAFIPVAIIAQDYQTIKPFFYNLPIEKNREEIYTAIKSDARFISNEKDSVNFGNTFLGVCKENGAIESQPDSNEVELTFGHRADFSKDPKKRAIKDVTYLKLRYHYANANTARTAYRQLMNRIRPLFRDSFATSIDTILSDDSIRRQLKTKGYTFKNKAAQWEVSVVLANITPIQWGVFLELEKVENPLKIHKQKKQAVRRKYPVAKGRPR